MSCGCKSNQDRRRTAAAMCVACPRSGIIQGVRICTESGRTTISHTDAQDCPIGRHPDKAGIVRWRWLRWYGVPMPLRWKIKDRLTKPLPGCGCVKPIKDLWLRLRGSSTM